MCPSGKAGLVQAVALALLLVSHPAAAAAPEAGATAPQMPLAVAVRTDWAEVSPEAIRRAIEGELRTWVVSVDPAAPVPAYAPRLAVDVSAARGDLTVRFDGPSHKPLVRVIAMPTGADDTIRHIAWLAGDLVRDQASDLLPPPPPPAAASRPLPPPPPPGVTAAVPTLVVQAAAVRPQQAYAPVTVSLLFPIASNAGDPDVRTHFSANLFYGRVGTLDHGLQLGLGNHVTGDASGAQVGVANAVGGDVDGAQLGIVNHAGGHVFGEQSGLINDAGDVHGLQLGLINVGKKVKGAQVGLINISDDIEGAPIGVINVSASGGVHPVFWTSGTEQLAAGLKLSTRRLYTLFSGAVSWLATGGGQDVRVAGPGFAIGMRFPIRSIVLESDLGGAFLFGSFFGERADATIASWRVMASYEIYRHLSLFAGAALSARFTYSQIFNGRGFGYELGPELLAGVQL